MKNFLPILLLVVLSTTQLWSQPVVGGSEAKEGDYPWMAALTNPDDFVCGGSLINDQWILTAGHCGLGLEGLIDPPTHVTLNQLDPYAEGAEAFRVDVDSIFVHPDYSLENGGPDIALIRLKNKVDIEILPFALADDMDSYAKQGTECKVMGWGSTNERGDPSDNLKEADIKIIEASICEALYKNQTPLTEFEVCAGYEEGEEQAGAGAGDSGGPLVMKKDGEWMQIGIVSSGGGTITTKEFPGRYTNVGKMSTWIAETMSQNTPVVASIKEARVKPSWDMYPNPNNSGRLSFSEQGDYTLTDLNGRALILVRNTNQMDVSALSQGLYLVKDSQHRVRLLRLQ